MKQTIVFEKMHGIGNDFMLIDNRKQSITLTANLIVLLANRKTSVGFDQLLLLDDSKLSGCDVSYRFFNPDGSEAEQCGNGQRCISKYLHMLNPEKLQFKVDGLAGIIESKIKPKEDIEVNMGIVSKLTKLVINNKDCHQVLFGNPHLVTEVDNIDNCDLNKLNESLTKDYINGINFEIAEVVSNNKIKIRVFERGTGETLACGSGACAAVAALIMDNKLNNKVEVTLPGGVLMVEYNETDNNMNLTGTATHVFTGEIKI